MAESNGFAGRSAEWQEGYQFGIDTFSSHIRPDFDRLKAENEHLRKTLSAAGGYLTNASIDLQTGAPKRTAINTIEGGLKMLREALESNALTEGQQV